MGDLVNLRLERKRRSRQDESDRADANRRRFGRTKAERQADERARQQAAISLDAHRRDVPEKP